VRILSQKMVSKFSGSGCYKFQVVLALWSLLCNLNRFVASRWKIDQKIVQQTSFFP